MRIFDASAPAFKQELFEFIEQLNDVTDVAETVQAVLADIRELGDGAVVKYAEKFDQFALKPEELRVPEAILEASVDALSKDEQTAFQTAIDSVRAFHQRTLPEPWTMRNAQGGMVGERYYPIRRVGLYVPGGQVPLASTVIMTTVLAQVAGVEEIAVTTPPMPGGDGMPSPVMLAALYLAGVREVYRLGGVQAIGALGYGTDSVPAVDKIFGPGSAYVNEAKRQLFGRVGIDLQPGPSEVMIIADATANPAFVAADLLAQAEHGTTKEKIYFTVPSLGFLEAVEASFAEQLKQCSHREAIQVVWDNATAAILCTDLNEAVVAANLVAPEHLELQVADAELAMLTEQITTAGAILQGHFAPTVLGDFTAGPSHTLPTGRTSRFSSGLQATDFMRRSSIVRYDEASLKNAAPVVEVFSRLEQLDAHGRSLSVRLPS